MLDTNTTLKIVQVALLILALAYLLHRKGTGTFILPIRQAFDRSSKMPRATRIGVIIATIMAILGFTIAGWAFWMVFAI